MTRMRLSRIQIAFLLGSWLFHPRFAFPQGQESCFRYYKPYAKAKPSPWDKGMTLPLGKLFDLLKRSGENGSSEFFEKLSNRATELRAISENLGERNLGALEKFHVQIGAQIPREGYVRALSPKEVRTILKEGKIGSSHDFNYRGEGARVGHGGNFIFLLCRKCSSENFTQGSLGSGVINRAPIPLEQLELIVPAVPR